MKKLSGFCIVMLLMVASAVQAGTVYTMVETVAPNPKTIVVSIQGQSLHMEEQGENAMADQGDITGGVEAVATMRQMAKFIDEVFAPIRAQLPIAMADNPMANLEKMDGFPIIAQRLSNGSVDSDIRFQGAAEVALDNNTFAPPPGYTERRMTGR